MNDDRQFKSWLSRKMEEKTYPPLPEGSLNTTNKDFLQNFHDKVIREGTRGIDKNDPNSFNTMLLGTSQLFGDGKEYVIPFYNPDTGKEVPHKSEEEWEELSDDEKRRDEEVLWLDRWRKEAKAGKITPYNTEEEAHNAMLQMRSLIINQ